jgi:hypothetical protein
MTGNPRLKQLGASSKANIRAEREQYIIARFYLYRAFSSASLCALKIAKIFTLRAALFPLYAQFHFPGC